MRPDAEVPFPSISPPPGHGAEGDSLRDWQRHWRRLLGFSPEKTLPFDEVPQVLMQVCASVPAKFAEFFGQLASAVDPGQDGSKRGPTAVGPKRQRDFLPLRVPLCLLKTCPQLTA